MIHFIYPANEGVPVSLTEEDVHLYIFSSETQKEIILNRIFQAYGLINLQSCFNHRTFYGKPFLLPERNDKGIEFNLSHTKDIYILGVTLYKRIGVDIEFQRPLHLEENFLNLILTDNEQTYLSQFIHDSKKSLSLFYHFWTRKEALLKGIGEGLQFGLKNIEFDLSIPELNAFRINSNYPLDYLWSVCSFDINQRYVGAFAIRGSFSKVYIMNYQEL